MLVQLASYEYTLIIEVIHLILSYMGIIKVALNQLVEAIQLHVFLTL